MVLENFFIHKYDERPLPKACAKGNMEDIKLMVEVVSPIDINDSKSIDGKTGAYFAAFHGREDVVAYLLENGARKEDVEQGKVDEKV